MFDLAKKIFLVLRLILGIAVSDFVGGPVFKFDQNTGRGNFFIALFLFSIAVGILALEIKYVVL